ncbi:efflux RND transporter periplasmic adaptor subunit [Undibacterium sp. Rencai35W]|uniref:efflux RND transporter periplasmic adaptor subunit n=1 Tax=Undibacterium sp. Rencai35W TaxID=3413046 RepID=UPI003BF08D0F
MIRDTSGQDAVIAATPVWRSKKVYLMTALAVVVIASVLIVSVAWSGSSQSVSAARLSIATVSRGSLVRDAAVNGRMVAANSPTLYSTAPSTVTLKVNAGDKVKKGEIVAELESPDLSNELKREQASYEQLEAEVARQHILARKQKLLARREADQAEIERISAERTYQRIENAGVLGVVAKIDFLKAQDAMKSAQIRAKHAEQATGLENEDVDLALKTRISQLQQQRLVRDNAQRRVDDLKLRAPVDGVVGTLSVANRSVVAANTALMTLVDLSQLEVELEIPESYVTDLGLGMNIEMTVNGIKAVGKLSAMSPEVVKNQVLARARFSGEQPAGLRQSQRVSARLLIEEKPNVLILPRGPFVESEGGRFAYIVESGVAVRRPIKIGATSVTAVEIADGLKVGDKVVISGTDTFQNAQRISINH